MVTGFSIHLVGAEVVGEVEFGGGAGLHADGGAGQLLGAGDAQLLCDQESLTVVIVDAREVEAVRGVARQRPGGVAGEQVDFAGLQRGQSRLRAQRHVLDLLVVTQHRGGDRPADIHVDAAPDPLVVRSAEAVEAGVYATDELAARLDAIERRAGTGNRSRAHQRRPCQDRRRNQPPRATLRSHRISLSPSASNNAAVIAVGVCYIVQRPFWNHFARSSRNVRHRPTVTCRSESA